MYSLYHGFNIIQWMLAIAIVVCIAVKPRFPTGVKTYPRSHFTASICIHYQCTTRIRTKIKTNNVFLV